MKKLGIVLMVMLIMVLVSGCDDDTAIEAQGITTLIDSCEGTAQLTIYIGKWNRSMTATCTATREEMDKHKAKTTTGK